MQLDQPRAWELPGLSCLRIAGPDAIKVLNGLCTAKLVDLKPGDATEAMFTDDRGRVLAHGIIAHQPDQAALWFAGFFIEPAKLVAHIDRFIFREDATPKDACAEYRAVLLSGNFAEHAGVLAQILATTLQVAPLNFGEHSNPAQHGTPALHSSWSIAAPITGANDRLCLIPLAEWSAWLDCLKVNAIQFGTADEFESRRVRNFWPQAPQDITERTLPQELDRDARAVSFTKGCYLGQETVARLDAMGEVQRKLCLVQFDGSANMESVAISTGQTLVRDGKEVGKLTSVAPLTSEGHRWALAMMRRGSMAVGSKFELAVTADGAATEINGTSANATAIPGMVVPHP